MLFITTLLSRRFATRIATPILFEHHQCFISRKSFISHLQRHWRGELKIMKLQSPVLDNLVTPEMKKLSDLFEKYNFELRIAGGAVRDVLLDKVPHDIDFATTATPTQMKEIFTKEGIRMVNMNGEKHGTITARIDDKENFEVTTLRIDVVTDGRRAEVAFTTDWQIDANRRDLTINAMFLDFQWNLYDYFNGREDLANRRIRFVGDATERIQEDYLRIMRYFRFFGRIADSNSVHEEATLEAIKQNVHGLKSISGERLWMEFSKILMGNFAASLMKIMVSCGVHTYLGLPENCNLEEFERVCGVTEETGCHVMTRLMALLSTDDELYDLDKRIKFSNEEFASGIFIIHNRDTPMGEDKMKFCQYLLVDSTGKQKITFEHICELLKYKNEEDLLEEFRQWTPPFLPVSGNDLVSLNIPKGPLFKRTLDEVRQVWKLSDFSLTRDELLERVPQILENVKATPRKQSPKPKRKRKE
ncbi:CCA tRNA nucleotidyltransferase 1, mitochondrial-like [Saccostrea echinata]|uniref:CCA tRNA nucleotidyltransferase 1, mitochondrial-like n=1 Tax=Saccostrea echinata TaxID=191078 RepID=UPI002A808EB0|nr:CCA tRNA nucleotidyltransferase 1, mitochondrial-like [Saccostrea echinata]